MAGIDERGWIKLSRSITDNFIWDFERPKYAMAWIDMLLMANYADKKIQFDGKVKVIKRGSFITSLAKLSERWDMNKRTVKRFLDMLQSDGMISYECTNKCTAIFISNYNAFQGFSDGECTADYTAECASECTADYTAECTQHKKVKKDKKVKKEKKGLTVSKDTVCSTDVQRVVGAWNDLGLSKIVKIVPNTTRYNLLNKRIKDYGLDNVLGAIEKVRQSDFLMGGGPKGWTATFDWIIKPDNFAKVLSGNYDGQKSASTGSKPVPAQPEQDMSWMKQYIEQRDRKRPKKAADDP